MTAGGNIGPLHAEWHGQGRAVVLLHGQPGSLEDWQWVVPHLADRYRVIVPDRPGYGRTGGRAGGFGRNAAAVVDLLDRLSVERAIWVGHSWAGAVVMVGAWKYPDRVAGVVLVSSIGPGERMGLGDRLLAAPLLGEAIAAATIGGLGSLLGRARLATLAGQRFGRTAGDAVDAITRLARNDSPVWRAFVEEQRHMVAELDSLTPALPRIAAPAIVLHGDHDRLVPLAVARANAACIPGARLIEVAGAGHLIPHDHPEAVAAAVDAIPAGDPPAH